MKAVGDLLTTYKRYQIRSSENCSSETLHTRWQKVSKKAKINKKNCQPRILHLPKLPFKCEGEIETFPDKQKQREFITTRTILQEMLKKILPSS